MLGLCSKLTLANNTVSLLLHNTNMDPGPEQVLGRRPETGRVGDPTEASNPSSGSGEPSSSLRGSKKRRKRAGTPPGSDPPASGTRAPVRVLRASSASADETSGAKNAAKKLGRQQRTRFPPVRLRSGNTPAIRTVTVKKTKAKKASQPTPRPKLSKSTRGKPRSPASSRTPSPEAEKEAPMFGEEMGVMQESSENVAGPGSAVNKDPPLRDHPDDVFCKPETKTRKWQRTCTTSQAKDVKKEESEEGENEIKEEELHEIGMQNEDGEDNNTAQPLRKRGRQQKEDKGPRQSKQRKKPPVQYVRCEIEGCGTVLAHPRYLQHHIKYQHLLKKKYVCSHPSCGRLFRLQKQLLRHAKHHTDQRDYICEYCARAFKSSHNLAVHRMIHTGEKPIQCEICGFTCRQKTSLNWHMKKHDAEALYQFSCSICGKKFEKKDSVNAHKAKSHPEVLIAEALAANGGTVLSSPVPATALAQTNHTSLSLDNQEEAGDSLTPLQQVVLPLSLQTPDDASQGQYVQLTTLPVGQVTPQQQAPALLQFTAATPAHVSSVSSINQPQLIQLSTFPASNVTSMATVDSQTPFLTLNSVTTLSSTDILAPQQAVQWNREASEGEHIPREGELWDRVIVGEGQQDVGEMAWEGNCRMKKEDEGIVWEREGERQIVFQCSEVHEDSLM